jgi:hypothetical protein
MQYLFFTVVALGGLAAGLFFGALPLRSTRMSEPQQRYSSLVGMISLGLVTVLIIIGQDLASWIAIASLFTAFGVGKIPLVHRALIRQWPFLKASTAKKAPAAKKA